MKRWCRNYLGKVKHFHLAIKTSYHVTVHHQDGNFSVGRPLDLLPQHGVDLYDLIWQPVVVQKCSHFAAEGAGLVLVQSQLQLSF